MPLGKSSTGGTNKTVRDLRKTRRRIRNTTGSLLGCNGSWYDLERMVYGIWNGTGFRNANELGQIRILDGTVGHISLEFQLNLK